MKEMWNERYAEEEYFYGTDPNKFYAEQLDTLKPGKILFPGEGEGRNAVYAAIKGWNVDAVDYSDEAKSKALKLAEKNNVKLNYDVIGLDEFVPEENKYDAVVLIFIHMNEEQRQLVHSRIVKSLKPGGKIILEAFSKEQIKNNSGGPGKSELLYSLEDIFEDFQDLDIELFVEKTINLSEGPRHSGSASVIRYVGTKP